MNDATVALLTLGCAKNEADSDAMARSLAEAGFSVVDDPTEASIVVINTCGFIQSAVEESIDAILDICDDDEVRSGRRSVVVTGCLPARYGDDLVQALPEVTTFIGCQEEGSLASRLQELTSQKEASSPGRAVAVDERLSLAAPYRYVKIAEGCNRRCTFCTIPFIRGPYQSVTEEAIVAALEEARAQGAREVDLIAQDSGCWGCDLGQGASLASLVRSLGSRWSDGWLRLLYIEPEGVTDELLEALAASPSFCAYLDIPAQHVDGAILHAMGRRGDGASLARLCQKIRRVLPQAFLRTTFIVGFPGETQERFEALCEFVAEGHFDYVGIFPYSPEEGTVAAELPQAVDEEEKLARWQTLRDLADEVSAKRFARLAGQTVEVLVEGIEEDGQRYGRTRFQAPEVDGVTFVDAGEVGEIVTVKIEDTLGYDLEGAVVR